MPQLLNENEVSYYLGEKHIYPKVEGVVPIVEDIIWASADVQSLELGDRIIDGRTNKLFTCSSKTDEKTVLVYTDSESIITLEYEVNSDSGDFEYSGTKIVPIGKAFSLVVVINDNEEIVQPVQPDPEEEEIPDSEEEEIIPDPDYEVSYWGPIYDFLVQYMPPAFYHLWSNGILMEFIVTSENSFDVCLSIFDGSGYTWFIETTVSKEHDVETGEYMAVIGEYSINYDPEVSKYIQERHAVGSALRALMETMPMELVDEILETPQ